MCEGVYYLDLIVTTFNNCKCCHVSKELCPVSFGLYVEMFCSLVEHEYDVQSTHHVIPTTLHFAVKSLFSFSTNCRQRCLKVTSVPDFCWRQTSSSSPPVCWCPMCKSTKEDSIVCTLYIYIFEMFSFIKNKAVLLISKNIFPYFLFHCS